MTTAAPGTILADALAYAAHGWPVIALHSLAQDGGCTCKMGLHCGSIGKHPHFDEELSPSGAHRGTTDAATILMWWDMWPSANVGIATGGRSGLLVLDVDGATGEASLQNLVNTYGPLPRTIESITGSGGRHILFSYPGYHSSNTAGILAPALDIRCCGGIFVAAPSLHRSGRRYEWEALHHPDDITTEAAPEWLLALLKPAPRPKSPFVAAAAGNRYPAPDVLPARSVAKVNAGEGRDNTGLWLACQMRDAGYAQSEAEAVLYEYGDDVPDSDSRGRHDPYDEADARRNARSAFSRPARAPWSGGHNPGEQRNGDGIAGEAPPPPEGPSPVNPEASATPAQGTETTELANAERFIHQHGADVRFVPAWKCWVVWDGTRWQRDELRLVRELAIKTVRSIYGEAAAAAEEAGAAALGSGGALIGAKHEVDEKWKHADALARWAKQSETDAKINAMLSLAEALPGVAVSPVVFDADGWLLNCKNGTLDLRTGDLLPHQREHMITKMCRANYDPNAEAPVWDRFLRRAMNGSDDKIAYLRRAFGYALRSETGEECIFCFFGSGRNGKSKALGAFEYVLGDYAKATRSDTFTEQGKGNNASSAAPDLADLAGVRFAPTTETGENSRIAESLLKWATGGDMIKARHLFSNLFLFKPQFKLFLASNHKPRITGTDEGIWSRIRTVPFTVTIPAEERDRNLSDKLEAEADGILRWAVEGCLEWQIHGLGEPDEVREATANYRAEMDVPGGFFSDCCVVHD